jgi:hypothetical protein
MTVHTQTLIAKPRQVEAFQWKDPAHPNDMPWFLREALADGAVTVLFDGGMMLQVHSITHGMKYAKPGDWVFEDQDGNIDVLPGDTAREQFTVSPYNDSQLWDLFCAKAKCIGVVPSYSIRERMLASLRKIEAEGYDLTTIRVEWTDHGLDVLGQLKKPDLGGVNRAAGQYWRNIQPGFPSGGQMSADDAALFAEGNKELRW